MLSVRRLGALTCVCLLDIYLAGSLFGKRRLILCLAMLVVAR